MAGTSEGAKKAYQSILDRYGEEYVREWKRKGGSKKVKKGFAKMSPEKLRELSIRGGKNGRSRTTS